MENRNVDDKKISFFAVLSLLLLLLISFNGASIFSIKIPYPENVAGDVSSSLSNLMFMVEEEHPSVNSNTHLDLPENTVAGAGDSMRLSSVFHGDSRKLVSETSPLSSLIFPVGEENPSANSKTHLELTEKMVAGAGDSMFLSSVFHGDSRKLVSETSSSSSLIFPVEEENPSVISKTHLELPGKIIAGAGDFRSLSYVLHSMHDVQPQQEKEHHMKQDPPSAISNTHLPLLRKSHRLPLESDDFASKKKKKLEILTLMEFSGGLRPGGFRARVKEFFSKNETSCKVRFFMTWISSLDSFTNKELHSIETLFNTHPNGCLLIVSNSMDSIKGRQILKPFSDKGFRVASISPDLNYLVKNTEAESWLSKLIKGEIDAGFIPLGQNLSNLLRLCLLYKFGGVYLDTDVIVTKSFSKLKNSIGAQTLDLDSKNWSRLNNAVMVFDKMHPLIFKFIEEFSLTFNGNKWGHNGPYLVSRVVSRLQGRPGYNFTILPPSVFYPVNWNRVRNLFRGPKNESDAKWLRGKLRQIRSQSYAVHLWNKQSRKLRIEEGSILRKILSDRCVFCNSSSNGVVSIE